MLENGEISDILQIMPSQRRRKREPISEKCLIVKIVIKNVDLLEDQNRLYISLFMSKHTIIKILSYRNINVWSQRRSQSIIY